MRDHKTLIFLIIFSFILLGIYKGFVLLSQIPFLPWPTNQLKVEIYWDLIVWFVGRKGRP